jgi:hypothetical protein
MWNFVGRQNDIQGKYDYLTETGSVVSLLLMNYTWEVKTISHRMYSIIKDAMCISLPFILGLIGLMYHANKDLKALRFTCFCSFYGNSTENLS